MRALEVRVADGRSVSLALLVELRGARVLDGLLLVEEAPVRELELGGVVALELELVEAAVDEVELLLAELDEVVGVLGVLVGVGVSDGLGGAAERVCCASGSDSPHPVSTNAAAQSAAGSAT
ncbi:hypothetical protein [Barrientosiimonas humi]|uniref:hypothetical protein n=1 Tax=Barrientosiimonas humi TaxID=999931 RepID=UPI00370DA351